MRSLVRRLTGLVSLAVAAAPAAAQEDARSRLRPATAEVRDAGTLHLGTGNWTRRAAPSAGLAGPQVLYANTCVVGYYLPLDPGERVTDEGALPSATMPVTPSTLIPGANDTAPGAATAYDVNGFQIAYCTQSAQFAATIAFHSGYQAPGVFCAIPGLPTASFALTGLPASDGLVQACWIVSIDLDAANAIFPLAATAGSGDSNAFGWSFQIDPPTVGPFNGPLLAGGPKSGTSYASCSGTDATRWDTGTASVSFPSNVVQVGSFPTTLEGGTGMLTQDAFRIDCTQCPGSGCGFFFGNPLASFHLELYGDGTLTCGPSIGASMCLPGQGGTIACPCGNAPTNAGAGCDNSGQGQAATGGGVLTASSGSCQASVGDDQVTLRAIEVRTNTTSVFLQGNQGLPAGVVFGDGVRCAGGTLLRLNSPGGTVSDSNGQVVYPNPSFPLPITQRAAQLGQPIAAGDTRWYAVYYRDPSLTFCPAPAGGTWNVTQTVQLVWVP